MSEKKKGRASAKRIVARRDGVLYPEVLDRLDDINESIFTKIVDECCIDDGSNLTCKPLLHKPYMSLLHLQIMKWIYYSSGLRSTTLYENNILNLAARGADIDIPVRGIMVYYNSNGTTYKIDEPSKPWEVLSKISTACAKWIRENGEKIRDLVKRARAANPNYSVPQQQPLPTDMQNLLFKDDLSDIRIHCRDGTTYPAHVLILSRSSPVLKSYFMGKWSEVQMEEGGRIYRYETETDSKIMKLLLTYMYTGRVSLVNRDTSYVVEILMAALMYEIEHLVEYCCRKVLTPRLSLETLKEITCTAYMIRRSDGNDEDDDDEEEEEKSSSSNNMVNNQLWMACTKFVYDNLASVVSDTDFITSLNNENVDIWKELQKELSQLNSKNNNKTTTNKKRKTS